MILNPWDVQSKRISTTDGTLPAIYAGRSAWMGSEMYIIKKKPDVVNSSGGVSQVHLTPITGRDAENGREQSESS